MQRSLRRTYNSRPSKRPADPNGHASRRRRSSDAEAHVAKFVALGIERSGRQADYQPRSQHAPLLSRLVVPASGSGSVRNSAEPVRSWSVFSSSVRSSPRPSPSSWCWRARSAISCCRSRSFPTSRRRRSSSARSIPARARRSSPTRSPRRSSSRSTASPGMTYMSSSSSNDGSANITITFDVGYPLSIAAVDVQNRVVAGGVVAAGDRQSGRRDDQEAEPELRADRQSDLAGQIGRSGGAQQLRLSADRRSAQASARRRRRADLRRAALFDARLARSRQARQSRHHRVDVQNAVAEQNVQVAAGKIGQSPAPAGTAFEMQVNAAGPAQRPAAVRRHRRARRSRQRGRWCGCAMSRASNSARLQYASSAFFGEDPTVVLADLSRCRARTRSTCKAARQDQDGRAVQALPEGHRVRDALRHDQVRVGLDARRGRHAGRGAAAGRRRRVHLPAELAHDAHSRPSPSRCR